MDRRTQREPQHLALPRAASLVYYHIVGEAPDARHPGSMRALLNDIAHAISNVAPVYAADPLAKAPKELSSVELLFGRFDRGASVFRARNGQEFHDLTVRRRDMLDAISILRSAHIQFRRAAAQKPFPP